MDKFIVSNDARKLAAITLSYVIIALCIVALAMTSQSNAMILIAALLLAAVLLLGIAHNVGRMLDTSAIFEFSEEAIRDLTKPTDVITLPWCQVVSVHLKAANSNDLMLDVIGYKTVDELGQLTSEMSAELEAGGGERIYYALELSGQWIRRSRIIGAFEWLQDHVANRYPDITFTDFKDPLRGLGKAKINGESR